MPAKYYVYRNLHTNTFSIRYKGKVIAHPTTILGTNAIFKVNEKGRQKVLTEKRKNVHAFVVLESYSLVDSTDFTKEVTYNPYTMSEFTETKPQSQVLLKNNKIFIKE